ncbi:MAG: 3'-5' exonuclease [Pirellulaceae bacterium]
MARGDKDHLAAVGYRRYQTELKAKGAVDFDDLLLLTEDLFVGFEKVRQAEAGRFDHLLIDEYQDTNQSQYRIVKALAKEHRNLCVVGDDDQSIYAWRGAEVEHILRFAKDWPDAKVVRLEENYRSTQAIIDVANRLIAFNKQRHDKVLRASRPNGPRPQILQFKDETEEARQVVVMIQQRLSEPGIDPRDLAILFRTNEQPRPFEAELRKARIPYALVGGQSFFDRKEVRDITALLRLIESDDDEVAFLRVANTPPRGLGPKAIETLMEQSRASGDGVWRHAQSPSSSEALPRAAADGLGRLVRAVHQSRAERGKRGLTDIAATLIEQVGYRQEVERTYPDPDERAARWNSVEEVINALAAFEAENKRADLGKFLDDLALNVQDFGNDKEKKLAGNAVALMTLHSAKGLEFPEVFMVGLEEGILPHHRSVAARGQRDR